MTMQSRKRRNKRPREGAVKEEITTVWGTVNKESSDKERIANE